MNTGVNFLKASVIWDVVVSKTCLSTMVDVAMFWMQHDLKNSMNEIVYP